VTDSRSAALQPIPTPGQRGGRSSELDFPSKGIVTSTGIRDPYSVGATPVGPAAWLIAINTHGGQSHAHERPNRHRQDVEQRVIRVVPGNGDEIVDHGHDGPESRRDEDLYRMPSLADPPQTNRDCEHEQGHSKIHHEIEDRPPQLDGTHVKCTVQPHRDRRSDGTDLDHP
jgi:hypothetical protein